MICFFRRGHERMGHASVEEREGTTQTYHWVMSKDFWNIAWDGRLFPISLSPSSLLRTRSPPTLSLEMLKAKPDYLIPVIISISCIPIEFFLDFIFPNCFEQISTFASPLPFFGSTYNPPIQRPLRAPL